jgi:uncharacterized protein YhhL (DUF1145 family)
MHDSSVTYTEYIKKSKHALCVLAGNQQHRSILMQLGQLWVRTTWIVASLITWTPFNYETRHIFSSVFVAIAFVPLLHATSIACVKVTWHTSMSCRVHASIKGQGSQHVWLFFPMQQLSKVLEGNTQLHIYRSVLRRVDQREEENENVDRNICK